MWHKRGRQGGMTMAGKRYGTRATSVNSKKYEFCAKVQKTSGLQLLTFELTIHGVAPVHVDVNSHLHTTSPSYLLPRENPLLQILTVDMYKFFGYPVCYCANLHRFQTTRQGSIRQSHPISRQTVERHDPSRNGPKSVQQ